jgi:hypothetical protein
MDFMGLHIACALTQNLDVQTQGRWWNYEIFEDDSLLLNMEVRNQPFHLFGKQQYLRKECDDKYVYIFITKLIRNERGLKQLQKDRQHNVCSAVIQVVLWARILSCIFQSILHNLLCEKHESSPHNNSYEVI